MRRRRRRGKSWISMGRQAATGRSLQASVPRQAPTAMALSIKDHHPALSSSDNRIRDDNVRVSIAYNKTRAVFMLRDDVGVAVD